MVDRNCNKCGQNSWKKVLETESKGHRYESTGDERVKEVFTCVGCGAEGRRFSEGVDGGTVHAGALR